MFETRKLNDYRISKNYFKYFKGNGIDIGCGNDILNKEIFLSSSIKAYDINDGDGETCFNLPDNSFDFVYSSHFLEHTKSPIEALKNWIRICKSKGYIVFAVPHEIYYEKDRWPSLFNEDHKWSFRMENKTNLPKSINIYLLLKEFEKEIDVISVELILRNFNFSNFLCDQTLGNGTCQIEVILRKV